MSNNTVNQQPDLFIIFIVSKQNAPDNQEDNFIQAIARGRMVINEECLKGKEGLVWYRGRYARGIASLVGFMRKSEPWVLRDFVWGEWLSARRRLSDAEEWRVL